MKQRKNRRLITSYSSLEYILLKMTTNLSLKQEVSTRAVTLLFDPFNDKFKMLNCRQISPKLLFAYNLSYKKYKSVKHRVTV